MEVVIWSSGEKFEKTNKNDKPLLNDKNQVIPNIMNIQNATEYNIRKKDKFNEERINEIMERQIMSQSCQNPFLNKDFNDVLLDQEKYLIPQNSLHKK